MARRSNFYNRRGSGGGKVTTVGAGPKSKQNQWKVISEGEFDASILRYRSERQASAAKIHPQFIPTQWNAGGQILSGFYDAKAPPDRCITIRELGSRTCWVEIKTWEGQNRHTHGDGLHQYEKMVEDQADSGALGFYAVKWRWKGVEEWRFYPVEQLKLTEDRTLVFEREAGLAVEESGGWPDWLPVVVKYVQTVERAAGLIGEVSR